MPNIKLDEKSIGLVIHEVSEILKTREKPGSRLRIKRDRDYNKIQKSMDKGGYDKEDLSRIIINLKPCEYHNTEVSDTNPDYKLHSFIKMLDEETYIKISIRLDKNRDEKYIWLVSFHLNEK